MPPSQASFDLALYLIITPPGDNTIHPPQLIVFVDHCLAPNKEIVKQFQLNKEFEDRRKKVISARTYFYEDEHKCDVHLETFLKCIDAVGKYVNRYHKLCSIFLQSILDKYCNLKLEERSFHVGMTSCTISLSQSKIIIITFIQDTHITGVLFSGVLHDTMIKKIYYKYINN